MSKMDFGILGSLTVRREKAAVMVRGPRIRALMALFLIHANEVLSSQRIADLLWDGDPPPSAPNTVQAHVMRLRRALTAASGPGAGQGPLATRPAGYVLDVSEDGLDARRFERMLNEGRAATDAGRPAHAEAILRASLALWRGAALGEFAQEPFAEREAQRLEQRRVEAHEVWAKAALACGRSAEVIMPLEALVREYPLREGLVAHLMTALYHAGRQADALGVYRATRLWLRDELGIDPGPQLKALERAILLQELEVPRRHPVNITVPTSLPPPATVDGPAFVERVDELDWLEVRWERALRRRGQLALLRGGPGTGKTRLAVAFAQRCHAHGAIVLWGRCVEDHALAFQPLSEAIAPLLRARVADIVRLLSDVDADADAGAPAAQQLERYRLFEAVAETLRTAAMAAPMVVVLDDLHLADAHTLALVVHLTRSLRSYPLLILAAGRSTDPGFSALMAAMAELRGDGLADFRTVGGLDPDELAALVRSVTGAEAPRPFVATLARRSGGNPFFALELLGHVDESAGGRYPFHAGDPADLQGPGVPEAIQMTIERQLSRLDFRTGSALAIAALMGRHVDVDSVAERVGADATVVAEAFDRAEQAGFLRASGRHDGSYAFSDEIVRDAVCASLRTSHRVVFPQVAGPDSPGVDTTVVSLRNHG